MNIEPVSPTVENPPAQFAGEVSVDMIAAPHDPDQRMTVAVVMFAPGGRTAWHSHARGQHLRVRRGVARFRRMLAAVAVASLIAAITACASKSDAPPGQVPAVASATPAPTATAPQATPATSTPETPEGIVGSVVRFTSDRTSVDVTIGEDSPGVRDFLSMLPLQVPLEEFAGREKIAFLPRALDYSGSPGSDPENGDLIYFTSWGNLGFYYNADGIDYSDATLHIGTYNATEEQLSLLEGDVTIEMIG